MILEGDYTRFEAASSCEDSPRLVRIQAVTLGGAALPEVEAAPFETIFKVKQALSYAAGAPAKYFSLVHGHRELDNGSTVAEEQLPEDSTMNLVRIAPEVISFSGIMEDDALMVNFLMDCMADPNERDELGWTALHWAAHRGHVCVAGAMVKLPEFSLVNAEDSGRMTVLHFFAQRGFTALCQAVAERPDFKKLNASSANGNTALHWAARGRHSATCEALLDMPGFSAVNGQNSSGWTALHYAAAAGLVDVCKKIIRHPKFSAFGAQTNGGETAYMWATKNGHREVCEIIKDASMGAASH